MWQVVWQDVMRNYDVIMSLQGRHTFDLAMNVRSAVPHAFLGILDVSAGAVFDSNPWRKNSEQKTAHFLQGFVL
jgi:hypothetical protein